MNTRTFGIGLLALVAVLVLSACSVAQPFVPNYGPGNMTLAPALRSGASAGVGGRGGMGGNGMMDGGGMMGGYGYRQSAPTISPTPSAATAEPVDREIQIAAANLRFVPAQVNVKPGEKVRFVITNTDSVLHNFGSDDAGIAYLPLPAGTTQSVVWTARTKASTYTAVCTLHAGMSLSIVVGN